MSSEHTVLCVAAARPNFMKIKPVVDALEAEGARVELVHTGQHYDANMSDVFFDELGLRKPDIHLGTGGGTHAEQAARVMTAFDPIVTESNASAVVVVGDVTSTMACALVGASRGLVVAHVEAGLRSRDWTMPEEVNRVVTDRVSDLLFAPSADAVVNLQREGYRADQIHLAGNVMVDTLLSNIDRARTLPVRAPRYGVVTLHRPASVDSAETLQPILDALSEISSNLPLYFPVHPRTAETLRYCSALPSTVKLLEPLGYLEMIAMVDHADLVMTDSGGLQEESTVLGTPCLTLRPNTERPITVTEGTNRVVGTARADIVRAATEVLADPPPKRSPALWDGHAGKRVAKVLISHLEAPARRRPTDLDDT